MTLKKIALILMAIGILFGLTSCEDLLQGLLGGGVTIQEQITAFQGSLNAAARDAEVLRSHLHPDMLNYQQLADLQVWEDGSLSSAYADFTFGAATVGANDVATCTYSAGNGTGTIEFSMRLDGSDYKILRIELTIDGVAGDPYVLERFDSK